MLTPPQSEVISSRILTSGFNCILQMPTGSGKTWLAEHGIEHVLAAGKRAIYLSPLRALATEISSNWHARFDADLVGIFTGDYGIPGRPYPVPFRDARLLVMTPERLDACTRAWRSHWHWIPEVDLVVVDEFHLLGDPHRGARLEGTLSRLRRLNPFARILGLSATLGNRAELADWLNAVDYVSSWRPIPLTWRTVRYRKATEKPALVVAEVQRNLQTHGKSLVFVQSRRRAEELSSYLCNCGLSAYHHHAGLSYSERGEVEALFRRQDIDVLVATATLEMGINLPVRQVILYDLQFFDGSDFRPLSINSVWQRVGRAGRHGLDMEGEAVLLMPTWDSSVERYEQGSFEPITSGLHDPSAIAEQIIAEVTSGLSRSAQQLKATFAHSLAAHQHVQPEIGPIIADMLASGMICKKEKREVDRPEPVFVATRLGHVASRHSLSPYTVLCFQKALTSEQNFTFFDLLLLATSQECEPELPVDYEELDSLVSFVAKESSYLLQRTRAQLADLLRIDGKRLLSALKMALVLRAWTRTGDRQLVAERHECYPFEVARLQESADRLLLAMYTILNSGEEDEAAHSDYVSTSERLQVVRTMVMAGLDESAVTLTLIDGLGPAFARRLFAAGIHDIEVLAQAESVDLSRLRGISNQRAEKWIRIATEVIRTKPANRYKENGPYFADDSTHWPGNIDPYRLRRAVDLQVKGTDGGTYLVSGGLEPHLVHHQQNQLMCDCADAIRGHLCKHVLAVRLTRGEKELKKLATHITVTPRDQKIDLFDLWTAKHT